MNNLFTKRIVTLLITALMFSSVTFSQTISEKLEEIKNVDYLKTTTTDGIKFLEAYLSPWMNAFGAGLSGGWYNTAKPHKFGGFDITFGTNIGFVPESDRTFDLSTLGLSANINPKTGTAPTIAGPFKQGPEMTYSVSGVDLATFNTPTGTGIKFIPVPTAQLGIGLPLGTEIKGRFIPKIPIGDGDIMLWGIGLMHSIIQYIPGNELLPVDVSLFGGYTRLNVNIPVSLQPGSPANYGPVYNPGSFDDQKLSTAVKAFNISAIASLNLPVITFYGGLGYTKTSTVINLVGNFPTPVIVTPALPDVPYAEYNDNGVKKGETFGEINIENFSGLRANIGFRLKLAVITIHADYTRAQYNVVSTGLGISFR